MIVNPYNEVISLHDVKIENIRVEDNNAYISLDQAYLLSGDGDYILDNPLIIIYDLVDIDSNKDYPFRIKILDDDELYTPSLDDFNKFEFEILEEAYGFGLVHFYGLASFYQDGKYGTYDAFIDFHYSGDLKIKWDDKVLLEV